LDTYPIPARSLERYYKINGRTLERDYKEHLSGFVGWEQAAHASDWVLLPENMGTHLSIDECMHQHDLFTFLSNKDGHGKQGTVIAIVRGTKASEVVSILMNLPETARSAVEEVTMDLSDSMRSIVNQAFPNARIVIDNFHLTKLLCDALDGMRMRVKKKAVAEMKRDECEFNRRKKLRKARRLAYRKKHPKKRGEKRGRPRLRSNEKFRPKELPNGDTKVELFTRARYILPKSGNKWSERQKERARLIFELAPNLKEAYGLVCAWRAIFCDRTLGREDARSKVREWGKKVAESRIDLFISAWQTIKAREEDVLNFFINRTSNAAAESLNSKIKGFRSELRGVRDLPFFFYRCCMIFG